MTSRPSHPPSPTWASRALPAQVPISPSWIQALGRCDGAVVWHNEAVDSPRTYSARLRAYFVLSWLPKRLRHPPTVLTHSSTAPPECVLRHRDQAGPGVVLRSVRRPSTSHRTPVAPRLAARVQVRRHPPFHHHDPHTDRPRDRSVLGRARRPSVRGRRALSARCACSHRHVVGPLHGADGGSHDGVSCGGPERIVAPGADPKANRRGGLTPPTHD
jgi:hypothetical protein